MGYKDHRNPVSTWYNFLKRKVEDANKKIIS